MSSIEVREAYIHFELYRLLTNIILSTSEFPPIKYECVHPEFIVEGRSANLVLDAWVDNAFSIF